MLGALLTFIVLFGLIKFFEKDRDDLDGFVVGMVAVVPVIANMLVGMLVAYLYPSPYAIIGVSMIVMITVTYLLLTMNLKIPAGRAAGYTAAAFLFNVGVGYLLTPG